MYVYIHAFLIVINGTPIRAFLVIKIAYFEVCRRHSKYVCNRKLNIQIVHGGGRGGVRAGFEQRDFAAKSGQKQPETKLERQHDNSRSCRVWCEHCRRKPISKILKFRRFLVPV